MKRPSVDDVWSWEVVLEGGMVDVGRSNEHNEGACCDVDVLLLGPPGPIASGSCTTVLL